jgi:molecular chaperone DnaK (HSP70)
MTVCIANFHGVECLRVVLTRAEFETKCDRLFEGVVDPISEALATADLEPHNIDNVLVIGGSCAIPRIRKIVSNIFDKAPLAGVPPLEAVARGAAVMASDERPGFATLQFGELEILDVCPFPLGVEVVGGIVDVMIKAGQSLPAEKTVTFSTAVTGQTCLTFDVYAGPWRMAYKNQKIVSFTVKDIPVAEAGEQSVRLTYHLDRDGFSSLTAVVVSSGMESSHTTTKAVHLYESPSVRRTRAEQRAAKAADEREAREAKQSAVMENLAKNIRAFLTDEPSKNPTFDRLVPPERRPIIQEIVDTKLSSSLGRAPSEDEVEEVKVKLENEMRKYFSVARSGTPRWMKPSRNGSSLSLFFSDWSRPPPASLLSPRRGVFE